MFDQDFVLISEREKLAVCDVTNLPYLDINWQLISIYGYFATSLTAYYSCADNNRRYKFSSHYQLTNKENYVILLVSHKIKGKVSIALSLSVTSAFWTVLGFCGSNKCQ